MDPRLFRSTMASFYVEAGNWSSVYTETSLFISPIATSHAGVRPTTFRTQSSSPTSGRGERAGFHTGLHGSAGSAVTGPTLSGCSPQSGASVHRGIIRGTRQNCAPLHWNSCFQTANVAELTAARTGGSLQPRKASVSSQLQFADQNFTTRD